MTPSTNWNTATPRGRGFNTSFFRSPWIRSMSLDRDTCTPLRAMTSRKMMPKYTAVLTAARGEKLTASMADRSISNMDRVRADMPKLAVTPRASPAMREISPMRPVSRNSSRDTWPWLRPRRR